MSIVQIRALATNCHFDTLVSIIIPFYNHVEITFNCLEAIASTVNNINIDDKALFEIVLVDDCSTEKFDQNRLTAGINARLIRNKKNSGFARSCNNGALEANGKYLLFLNNDTIPLTGWLENLLLAIESDPSIGMVGSKLLYEDNTIQHAGVAFDENNMPFHIYSGLPASFRGANKQREYQAVTGACFIIEKSLFDKMGQFDEAYLNGLEDIDLCLKVKMAGYKILYNPESCLYHLESQTRKPTNLKNVEIFNSRWNNRNLTDYLNYYKEDLPNINEDRHDEFLGIIHKVKNYITLNKTTIVVWGAGRSGSKAIEFLGLTGIIPDLVIDSDHTKSGLKLDGIVINSPDYLAKLKQSGQSLFVFIASMWYAEIADQLLQLGFKKNEEFMRI